MLKGSGFRAQGSGLMFPCRCKQCNRVRTVSGAFVCHVVSCRLHLPCTRTRSRRVCTPYHVRMSLHHHHIVRARHVAGEARLASREVHRGAAVRGADPVHAAPAPTSTPATRVHYMTLRTVHVDRPFRGAPSLYPLAPASI